VPSALSEPRASAAYLPQFFVAQIVVSWIYLILPPSTLIKFPLAVPFGFVLSMNGKSLKMLNPPTSSSMTYLRFPIVKFSGNSAVHVSSQNTAK
jgi:hypothetical protein